MRVFVTGATGFIGSAVVRDLIEAGHSVLGVSRSDDGAEKLRAAGADVYRGSLDDADHLAAGAAEADGVIHTAFNHDFSKFKENCETDRRVIRAFGKALSGSNRPLVITSGTALLPAGRMVTEADEYSVGSDKIPRVASEEAAQEIAAHGINVSVMRLPPSVHGTGDHGFVPLLINMAREKGVAAYIGAGANRWPAVHRFDAARAFRLALEKAVPGARYHAAAEAGIAFREIAEAIGRHLHVPVVGKAPDEAADHFGWFAHFAAIDNHVSSAATRERLGWNPTGPGLIEDLEQPSYFATI